MSWWIPELIRVIVLVGGAVLVERLIRRHGVGYAEEVFRRTPRAGAAFLALADIAYFLIVVAYVSFTVHVEPYGDTLETQFQDVITTVGGLALIIGGLHALNVFLLPWVGRTLAPHDRPGGKR